MKQKRPLVSGFFSPRSVSRSKEEKNVDSRARSSNLFSFKENDFQSHLYVQGRTRSVQIAKGSSLCQTITSLLLSCQHHNASHRTHQACLTPKLLPHSAKNTPSRPIHQLGRGPLVSTPHMLNLQQTVHHRRPCQSACAHSYWRKEISVPFPWLRYQVLHYLGCLTILTETFWQYKSKRQPESTVKKNPCHLIPSLTTVSPSYRTHLGPGSRTSRSKTHSILQTGTHSDDSGSPSNSHAEACRSESLPPLDCPPALEDSRLYFFSEQHSECDSPAPPWMFASGSDTSSDQDYQDSLPSPSATTHSESFYPAILSQQPTSPLQPYYHPSQDLPTYFDYQSPPSEFFGDCLPSLLLPVPKTNTVFSPHSTLSYPLTRASESTWRRSSLHGALG